MAGRSKPSRSVSSRRAGREIQTVSIGVTGAVVLVLLGILTALYVVGFTTAILKDREPTIALHAILPVIGSALAYLMRKVWK